MNEADGRGRLHRWVTWPRRTLRNVSMVTRLAVAVLAVTIASLVIASAVSLTFGSDLSDDLVESQFESRLTLKVDEVERHLRFTMRQVAALADSRAVVDSLQALRPAFAATPPPDESADEAVATYYRDQVAPALDERGISVLWRDLVPEGGAGIYLQDLYTVAPGDAETRRTIDDAGDDSAWTEVHREVHGAFLEVADRLGFADIALVSLDGDVVYTVAKNPEFATNLDFGPHSGSTLAVLTRAVRDDPTAETVFVVDVAPSIPDLAVPMGFFAAPLYDEGSLVGVLAIKWSTATLDDILTSQGRWAEEGFGDTGEAFIVAHDGRMRTVSRAFADDPDGYVEDVATTGTASDDELLAMAGTGTTVNFQRVTDPGGFTEAVDGGDLFETTSYLGRDVFAQYRRIEMDDLDWAVATQIDRDEVLAPVTDFRNDVMVAVAVFVIVITFATVAWASRVFQPIRSISSMLRRLHDGEDATDVELPTRAPQDFVDLAGNIEEMISALREREAERQHAAEQRLQTLEALLPPAVARRIESGDRRVLDQVVQASVVVLVVDGLGEMIRGMGAESRHHLDDLVADLDRLADGHGVEPVKLLGDMYVAGCGLGHPYLDHAPRAVAFAEAAAEMVESRAGEGGARLGIAAGVKSGPVTLGLAGSSLLVFDLWGPTFDGAHALARAARPGQILLATRTKEMLPADYTVRPWDGSPGGEGAWELVSPVVSGERER